MNSGSEVCSTCQIISRSESVVKADLDKAQTPGKISFMRYNVIVEPVEAAEHMPGCFYAHVPSLDITTHGNGVEGALAAARDLIHLWVNEKRAAGESLAPAGESLLTSVEVD